MSATRPFQGEQKRELPASSLLRDRERGSATRASCDGPAAFQLLSAPELVAEVTFDHVSGHRIRHGAKLKRWREDKDPRDCKIDQLES